MDISLIALFFLVINQQWHILSRNQISYFLPRHIQHLDNRSRYSKEAFVTIINSQPNYIELLDVLLDSIHLFSKRSIIVFSIDFDLIINYTRHPHVTIERISQRDCGSTIYACKILAIILSEVNYGVQVEIDSVVNYNVDLLFDMLHVWPYDLPLAPKHPNDPKNYRFYMEEYNVKHRSTLYMHGTFVWTYRAYPFIRRILKLMQRGAFTDANCDETAMNMLWKINANHILCRYDPFGPIYIDKYERPEKSPSCLPYCDGVYLIFHGQKDSSVSKNILERLYKLGPHRPLVQTPQGIKWFNDTNVTCCHSSATRLSSLHPLLCEYQRYNIV